jgi:hypothetical protein
MAKNSWQVVTEDGVHTVVVEHGYFSGRINGSRIKIYVDDTLVLKKFKQHTQWSLSSQHHFTLDGHDAVLYIVKSPYGVSYTYDLLLDGRSITTGEAVPEQPRTPMPAWGWLFAAGCIVAFIGGSSLLLQLLDAQPTTTLILYGPAAWAACYCLRICGNASVSVRRRVVKASITVRVVFAASVAATAATILSNQSYWHTYTSPAERYSVSVPCAAKEVTKNQGREMSCHDANMGYLVWDTPMSHSAEDTDPDKVLSSVMDNVRHPSSGATVQVSREKPIVLQTYMGREYTAYYGKGTVECRVFIANGRIYSVFVVAQRKSLSSEKASKFLDSFSLLPSPEKSQ